MINENDHNDAIPALFSKVITGEATKAEKSELENILLEDPSARKEYDQLVKVWNSTQSVSGLTRSEIEKDWKNVRAQIKTSGHTPTPWLKIAASVLVILTLGIAASLLFFNKEVRYIAENNSVEKILSDGSEITLNKNSSLSLKKGFGRKNREVILKGEAFFDVKNNTDLPFIISANQLNIRVVGTKFNIRTNKNITEVFVTEGTVLLKTDTKERKVTKDQMAVFRPDKDQLFISDIDDPNFLSWKTKKLIFQDVPLKDVIEKLNEIYERKMVIKNPEIGKCKITVEFNNEDLQDILRILEALLQIEINSSADPIIITGEQC